MARSAANTASTAAGRRRAATRGASGATRAPKRAAKRPAAGAPKKRAPARRAVRRGGGRSKPPSSRRSPRPRPRRRATPLAARSRSRFGWRGRTLALVCLLAICVAGYFLWLRDSSLVAVDDVDVVGVTAGDREAVVAELTRVAESMTTLNPDVERIERAAAAFPTIDRVSVDMNFPHGARIEVSEHRPTLVLTGEEPIPVAADGTLLPGVPVPDEGVPGLELDQPPGGERLEGEPLEQALVVGAAPDELRPLIERLEFTGGYGVVAVLRGDIPVRFGTGSEADAKWAAAAAVLADPKLDSLCSLDVRVPARPAAGCAATPVEAAAVSE